MAPVSPQVLSLLSALVEERTGIAYDTREHALFADKVLTRAREVGFESALDYYYFLRYDPAAGPEFSGLIDALVVTETYFFREAGPLRTIVEQILVPAARRGDRPRVWSAACASGDEPLTIAMMLDEAGALDATQIVASDLSLRASERAKASGFVPAPCGRCPRARSAGFTSMASARASSVACSRPSTGAGST